MNKEMTIGIVLIAIGAILMAVLVAIGNYYLQVGRTKKAKESKEEIISHQDSSSNQITEIIQGTQDTIRMSTDKIIQEHKKIPKVTQTGKNNVYVEEGNTGEIKVGDTYNKPPQRQLQQSDLDKIFSLVTDKNMKIKVVSNGSIEGNKFRNEILSTLKSLGYTYLVEVTVPMSMNYYKYERLTVKPGKYGNDTWIEVIANPQE